MTSNYADPLERRAFEVGPCRCPIPEPRPHTTDTVSVRRLGYGDRGRIRQTARTRGPEASNLVAIELAVVEWNLVLAGNKPRPIDGVSLALLDEATVEKLVEDDGAIDWALAEDPLPNASGAPSPDGPLASASPTPTSPAPTSSTTT